MARPMGGSVTSANAEWRRSRHGKDQHGRPWWCAWDRRAGGPVGPMQPDGWEAPFMPPQKYLNWNEESNRVTIDYDRLIQDRQTALAEWRAQRIDAGTRIHGAAFDHTKEDTTPQVLQEIGPMPMAWEPWVACKQGNQYALGLTARVDERLVPFLPRHKTQATPDFSEPDFSENPGVDTTPHYAKRSGRGIPRDLADKLREATTEPVG